MLEIFSNACSFYRLKYVMLTLVPTLLPWDWSGQYMHSLSINSCHGVSLYAAACTIHMSGQCNLINVTVCA